MYCIFIAYRWLLMLSAFLVTEYSHTNSKSFCGSAEKQHVPEEVQHSWDPEQWSCCFCKCCEFIVPVLYQELFSVFSALFTDCFCTLCRVWRIPHLFTPGASVSGALVEVLSNRQALVSSLHFSSVEVSGCCPLIHAISYLFSRISWKRSNILMSKRHLLKAVCLSLWRFVSVGTKVCTPAAPLTHFCSSCLSYILCADVCRGRTLYPLMCGLCRW